MIQCDFSKATQQNPWLCCDMNLSRANASYLVIYAIILELSRCCQVIGEGGEERILILWIKCQGNS